MQRIEPVAPTWHARPEKKEMKDPNIASQACRKSPYKLCGSGSHGEMSHARLGVAEGSLKTKIQATIMHQAPEDFVAVYLIPMIIVNASSFIPRPTRPDPRYRSDQLRAAHARRSSPCMRGHLRAYDIIAVAENIGNT